MSTDPADPLGLHPATQKVAQTADHERRLGAIERRKFDPEAWRPPIEPTRRVATAGNPSFEPGWGHYLNPGGFGGAETLYVEFFRTAENIVTLQGIATNFGGGTAVIVILPNSYRPAVSRYYTNRGTSGVSGAVNTVWVRPDGAIWCAVGVGEIVYLDGIVWRV